MSPTAHTGKFKDPTTPSTRLYGEVLSTKSNLHFVKVTRRNAKPVTPYNTIVPVEEFTTLSQPDSTEFVGNAGANNYYWRRQLRGKDGRFIEMGGGIEWIDSKGKRRVGIVDGFDDEIERVIVKDSDGNEYKLSADEIKQSATKALLPDSTTPEDEEAPTTPGEPTGGTEAPGPPKEEEGETDLDDLLSSLDNEPVAFQEFLGDESKFPIGGPPLEIKDSQGRHIANVYKKKDKNGKLSIIFELLIVLLPHELDRFLRNTGQSGRK